MSEASTAKRCAKCGGPITAEAPEGLCPKCLLLAVSLPTESGKEASPKPPPPACAELAQAFPQLEILELIGQGGMGFVFKARQPKLDRLVALKILPQQLAADPAFAARFTREGQLLARLTHPNIVAVHDFGQANGFFYLLMEYVDGVNLRQAMRAGRFTPDQALAIVPKICEALQYAHGEGVLHRDIKPENILLDTKGRVKIADFGIAKLRGDQATGGTLTGTGTALGTPHYMAPEQIETPADVDHRADIYSLGVVFYEMLTGELPLGRFAPPSAKTPVDPRVDEVVLRALEKERERRPQTADEVKTQVETIASTEPAPQPKAPLRLASTPAGHGTSPSPLQGEREPARAAVQGSKPQSRSRAIARWPKLALAGGGAIVLVLGLILLVQWARGFHHASVSLPSTLTVTFVRPTNQVVGGSNPSPPAAAPTNSPAPSTAAGGSNAPTAIDPTTGLPIPPPAAAAANQVRTVGMWSETFLQPGQILTAKVMLPDKPIGDARSSAFIHWQPESVGVSSAFDWWFGGHMNGQFGEREAAAADDQLRNQICGKPFTLEAGKPLQVFSVTNQSGQLMTGYVEYDREAPKPAPVSFWHAAPKPQAIVHIRRFAAYLPTVDYSVKLPEGFALRATVSLTAASTNNHADGESTSLPARPSMVQATTQYPQPGKSADYYSSWYVPLEFKYASAKPVRPGRMGSSEALVKPRPLPTPGRDEYTTQSTSIQTQLQELLDRGPIPVALGEPRLLFAATNGVGDVYRGFLELVGPGPARSQDPSTTQARAP